jgi:hypothetical protein
MVHYFSRITVEIYLPADLLQNTLGNLPCFWGSEAHPKCQFPQGKLRPSKECLCFLNKRLPTVIFFTFCHFLHLDPETRAVMLNVQFCRVQLWASLSSVADLDLGSGIRDPVLFLPMDPESNSYF